jgi:hypothetical protein
VGVHVLLDVDAYDAAETAASDRFPNRIVQAFSPEMFQTLGYPMRVKRADQLWRYIDVMHETRTHFNMEVLLKGLTAEEFELYKRVVKIVDDFTAKEFGMRAHPTPALLRAIHALRLIKIVTGNARPPVLEVGPGCGYLAMLLVMEGYPYIGTDVAQAFYLYQNRMLSLVAAELRELATEDGDILTVPQPKPGTAIHIPWWKWITLSPEEIKLAAGVMTCNHALCEMHTHSMIYLTVVARRMLSNFPGGGKFVFENWGYNLLHSEQSVAQKFAEHGLRVVHDEYAMSAMVLEEEVECWANAPTSTPAVQLTPAPVAAASAGTTALQRRDWRRIMRRRVSAALNAAPPLKRLAIRIYQRIKSPETTEELPVVEAVVHPVVANTPRPFPLSKRLTEGMAAVTATAAIREPELETFLESFFDGEVPRLPDEIFLDIIGIRF